MVERRQVRRGHGERTDVVEIYDSLTLSHTAEISVPPKRATNAVALAHAKDNLRGKWGGIKVVGVHASGNGHFKVGDTMQVEALVDTPGLSPQDVCVQLYAGPISATGHIERPEARTMQYSKEMAPNRHLFTGSVACTTSGRHGFAIRAQMSASSFMRCLAVVARKRSRASP